MILGRTADNHFYNFILVSNTAIFYNYFLLLLTPYYKLLTTDYRLLSTDYFLPTTIYRLLSTYYLLSSIPAPFLQSSASQTLCSPI